MILKSLFCLTFTLLCLHINTQSPHFLDSDPSIPIIDPNSSITPDNQNIKEVQHHYKTLTLHGSVAFGYYFTTLYFGSPPQRQTLIVDTGSSITTIPCKECGSSCGTKHLSNLFDPTMSKSFVEMTCHERSGNYLCNNCKETCSFDIRYSEGSSYHGTFKKDYIYLDEPEEIANPGHTSLRKGGSEDSGQRRLEDSNHLATQNKDKGMFMPFGCTLKETNLFLTQEADGILGLGVETNTPWTPPNIVDFVHMTDSSIPNAFSLCLGQVGGYLGVGGYNTTYHSPSEEIQYTPYTGGGQYRVYWKSVKFEGQTLELKEFTLNEDKGAYIDSGTTLFYTSYEIARVINDALSTYCRKEGNCGGNKKEDICWIHDTDEYPTVEEFYATFGTFTFQFGRSGETEYEWKPEDYLFHYAPDTPYYCLGMERLNGKKTLFGGAFMKNHDILFDKENKRIGFIRSDCSADYSLDSYPANMRAIVPGGIEPTVHVLRTMLYIVLGLTFMFLAFNLWWSYAKKRDSGDKNSGVELRVSTETQNEESDFKRLTGEDSPKFQRLTEEFAV